MNDGHGTDSPPGGSRVAWLLAFALAAATFLALAWKLDFLCDDAYISFVYARHWAEGLGPVFNPAREVPVEGYSNFLWVAWLAAGARLGLDIPSLAKVGSTLAGLWLLALVLRVVARELRPSARGLVATGLFLATLPPIALWATGGLAALPTTLAVFGAFEALLARGDRPRARVAATWMIAAALVRADGAVWCALLLATGGLVWLARGRPRALLRALVVCGALLAAAIGAHVAWRLSYYGDWLPNTARVKAGFSLARLGRGLDYVVAWLLLLPAVPLALLGALALPRKWSAPPAPSLTIGLATAIVALGTFAYAIWVGGDFMPFGRFLLPAVPFVALAFAQCWTRLEGRAPLAAGAFALLSIALGLAASFDRNVVPSAVREHFHFRRDRAFQTELERREEMDRNARRWVWLGRALDAHTRPEESILLGGIGAAAYESKLFVWDSYGLVTPEVVEHGEVQPNASPGHDLRLPPHRFFDYRPTYLGAILVFTGDGERPWWADQLPDNWERNPLREVVRLVRHALPESEGYPPNAELVLFRCLWADEEPR